MASRQNKSKRKVCCIGIYVLLFLLLLLNYVLYLLSLLQEPLTSTMVNGDIVSDTEIYVDEETAKTGRKDDVYDFEG